ncbi:uncharacterized protein LOC141613738 [Silene latifolia]|uniref:uncharacterized protein LOC141613738 n=1 Tax=Silene latifolia TaxID=37657 RepID=UPI003D784D27
MMMIDGEVECGRVLREVKLLGSCVVIGTYGRWSIYEISNLQYGIHLWGQAPNFLDRVKEEWARSYEGHKMFGIVKKLKALKPQHLAKDPNNSVLVDQEIELLSEVRSLTAARDSFLQQKAKIHWTKEGDQNTALFHGAIKKRYMVNKVIQIEDQQGKLCQDSQSIQAAFLDYYMDLLGSTKETENVRMDILNRGNLCTQEHWSTLKKPVTNEEIKQVFFETPIDKSPGPDGLSLILPEIIHENQGAFIRGRFILENVLIFQDIVKMYNRKSASPRCLFKIDLQKAYDSVEWDFVEQMLMGLNFPALFT